MPHLKRDCPGCADKITMRYYGYFFGMRTTGREVRIVEVTERTVELIDKQFSANGTLRGYVIRLFRRGAKENSPLAVEFGERHVDTSSLPESTKLREHLERIWFKRSKPAGKPSDFSLSERNGLVYSKRLTNGEEK